MQESACLVCRAVPTDRSTKTATDHGSFNIEVLESALIRNGKPWSVPDSSDSSDSSPFFVVPAANGYVHSAPITSMSWPAISSMLLSDELIATLSARVGLNRITSDFETLCQMGSITL